MDTGKLRHYIEVQSYTTTKNAVGETQKTWAKKFNCWAKIAPVSTAVIDDGQGENYETTHNIQIRYYGTISITDRIAWQGRIFEIVEVINYDTRKTYQHIKAKELQS